MTVVKQTPSNEPVTQTTNLRKWRTGTGLQVVEALVYHEAGRCHLQYRLACCGDTGSTEIKHEAIVDPKEVK